MNALNCIYDNLGEIISSIIQASGAIIAALIAAQYAKKIVEDIKFRTYSDDPDDVCHVLKKSKNDILIITVIGDHLLKATEKTLKRKLKSGIHVRYLLLSSDKFLEAEEYLHGSNAKSINVHNRTLRTLQNLQREYPDKFELRFFSSYMTASYIGIDTCSYSINGNTLISPFIRIMLYQYHVNADDSILWSIYEKTNKKQYDIIASSMIDMWNNATIKQIKNVNI